MDSHQKNGKDTHTQKMLNRTPAQSRSKEDELTPGPKVQRKTVKKFQRRLQSKRIMTLWQCEEFIVRTQTKRVKKHKTRSQSRGQFELCDYKEVIERTELEVIEQAQLDDFEKNIDSEVQKLFDELRNINKEPECYEVQVKKGSVILFLTSSNNLPPENLPTAENFVFKKGNHQPIYNHHK
jgi:hypothetical protein